MGKRVSIMLAAIGGLALVLPGAARAAEVKVLASVAMKAALEDLVPRYEAASGNTVAIDYSTAAAIKTKIEAGAPFDVSVNLAAASDAFIKAGIAAAEPRAVVGVAVASLAYRTGTPKPQIDTDAALKATVLAAPAISISDPANGGASSVYFISIMKRLGIEDAVRAKLMLTKVGEGAFPVAAGKAPLGVAQTSEIAAVSGVSGVPIFPADPAGTTTLVATVASKTAQPAAARGFVAFLLSPDAVKVRKAKGLLAD